jgi:hypothetical protein
LYIRDLQECVKRIAWLLSIYSPAAVVVVVVTAAHDSGVYDCSNFLDVGITLGFMGARTSDAPSRACYVLKGRCMLLLSSESSFKKSLSISHGNVSRRIP